MYCSTGQEDQELLPGSEMTSTSQVQYLYAKFSQNRSFLAIWLSAKMHAIFVKENKFDNEVLFKISSEDTQGYIFVKRALNNLTTPFVMNCYADIIVCQFLQGSHSFEQAFICLLAITGCIMHYAVQQYGIKACSHFIWQNP